MTASALPKPIEIGLLRAPPMARCRRKRSDVHWYGRARRKGDLVWSSWSTRE
jgi:hypothetical protein